ncbi:hypothetical protein [Pantoea agglomerans]|uniref:hypothetical protein n=1 Tax=Enterobacter agglomerans TaxID=549 RepID=UPI003C7E93A9
MNKMYTARVIRNDERKTYCEIIKIKTGLWVSLEKKIVLIPIKEALNIFREIARINERIYVYLAESYPELDFTRLDDYVYKLINQENDFEEGTALSCIGIIEEGSQPRLYELGIDTKEALDLAAMTDSIEWKLEALFSNAESFQ